MTFSSIADAEQLSELARVLDDHCRQLGIGRGHPASEKAARRIMALFNQGVRNPELIRKVLEAYPRLTRESRPGMAKSGMN